MRLVGVCRALSPWVGLPSKFDLAVDLLDSLLKNVDDKNIEHFKGRLDKNFEE